MNRSDVHALIQSRLGKIVADAWGGSRLTVIVVAHDDSSRPQQRTLYRLLEHVLERRPDLPLLVEGFAGPPSRCAAIAESPRRSREAASAIDRGEPAVQVLARLHPAASAVLGVDSESLIASQRAEQAALDDASLRDAGPALAVLLEEVARLARSPACERILAAQHAFERSGDVAAFGEELAVHAADMGVSLAGYPNLVARRAALAKQKSVDAHKLEPERLAVVQRLIRISEGPLEPARALAVETWLARTGLDDLGAIVRQAAAESQPAWLKAHSVLSLGLRAGPASSAHYYAQLTDLAAALGVELPGTLRRHCDHVALARSVDARALLVELSALADELADRTVSSAVEHGVLALRRELRELDQLLHLRLPAAQVRPVLANHPGAVQWTLDVLRLGIHLRPDLWHVDRLADASRHGMACALVVDQRLAHVRDYYFYTLCRSTQLISGAIAHGLDRSPAVALVCGCFHVHEIVRVLRSESELSWAIVVPHDEPQR